jgi:hypothetical protein
LSLTSHLLRRIGGATPGRMQTQEPGQQPDRLLLNVGR